LKQAQKLGDKVNELLEKNPAIIEALRVFNISYEQYQKAMESSYNFYTDTSTSPRDIKFKKSV
jgi:hypothetical protein